MGRVLQRGARQQQLVVSLDLTQVLRDDRLLVLDLVSFINDDVPVAEPLQVFQTYVHSLVARQTHIEFVWLKIPRKDLISFLF